MSNTEVLEKIKKLLRLGQSPNQHEAELAVQRAFELAARHQIDIESVSLEDDIRKIVSEKMPCGARLSLARKLTLNLLCAYFNVSVVISAVPPWRRKMGVQPAVTFIGKAVDIQIAKHVYEFLHGCCARALREFCAEKARRPARSTQQSFVQGFIYGVGSKLSEAKEQLPDQQGLVLNEKARREKTKHDLFNPDNLKPVKAEADRRNENALRSGWVEGKKVEVRKPIATNAAGQMLIGI